MTNPDPHRWRGGWLPRRSPEQRGSESGFVLMSVMAMMLIVSLATMALLAMTITVMRVTEAYSTKATRIRAADGALEIVSSRLRLDTNAVGQGCVGAGVHEGFASSYDIQTVLDDGTTVGVIVECSADLVDSTQRVLTFTARTGNDHNVSGSARVRIADTVGAAPSPGVEMIVCDWQLGAALGASLADCPTP